MNITLTGKTYDHRQRIAQLGGRFDGKTKTWSVRNASSEAINEFKTMSGVNVVGLPDDQTPRPQPNPAPEVTSEPMIIGDDTTYLNAFHHKNHKTFAGFSSLKAFADYVDAIPSAIQSDDTNHRNNGWTIGNSEFFGTYDMAGALDYARDGWHAGVLKAQRAIEIIDADHATARKPVYSVAGGRVNVGRMLSGSPLHMTHRTRQPARKVVTLYVECVISSGIEAGNAILRAAMIGAMSDILENNGYSCEIVSIINARNRENEPLFQIVTKIKEPGEPLSVNDTIFALGHPALLRRMGFAIVAINPAMQKEWGYKGLILNAINDDELEPNSFYLPALSLNIEAQIEGSTFQERVRSLFPLIVPDNFPVNLKG